MSMMSTRRLNVTLFLVSFLMLFAEVVLIRWLSTQSRIFAYVNNLVLLSAFLGIGIGSYFSRRRICHWLIAVSMTALLLLIELPLYVTIDGESLHLFRDVPILLSAFTDSVIWYEAVSEAALGRTLLGMLSVFILFFGVLVSFVPLGQVLGRSLDEHPNTIGAYSLNIFASIVGVWALAVVSFVYAPPWVWFAIVVAFFVLLIMVRERRRWFDYASAALLLAATIGLLIVPGKGDEVVETVWSPYQKLVIREMVHTPTGVQRGFLLNVNDVGYMGLQDLSDTFIIAHPSLYNLESRRFSQYDIPYQFKPKADEVLILGAGAGNDAAGALRYDVGRVDAVEIDPGIYKIGREYHPERPYDDPRVNVIIDDARAFLDRTDKYYDVISVGLLDAHTLSSSYNNMRIDHYVYTLESFHQMRQCLKPDGILTVAFEARREWIRQRLHDLLTETFGHEPLVLKYPHTQYGFGGTMYITARDMSAVWRSIAENPPLEQFVDYSEANMSARGEPDDQVKLTTDDWPYLYLKSPRIPNMHLTIMAILIVMVIGAGRLIVRREGRLNWHFFFLGGAFLLLEFQNISKSILLLGSTWLVNSVIITGILVLVLLGNLYTWKFKPRRVTVFYYLVFACLLAIYLVPLSWFNALPFWPRMIVGTGFLNLPIFFASIIFITSFRKVESKDHAFGSNLLGSAVGGVLESLSFVVGINALAILALAFYAAAMWTRKR